MVCSRDSDGCGWPAGGFKGSMNLKRITKKESARKSEAKKAEKQRGFKLRLAPLEESAF